jgi:O-antigen/teichoic acid export membrane protein
MSLKKQTLSGVIWTFTDVFLVKGLSFFAMILLARWIGPTDFGLIGMIAVFIAIGKSLTDSGMSNSLIRTKEASESDYSTVFFVNISMSIIVYFAIYYLAPLIADFFGYNILVKLIRVYCLVFLLTAVSAVHLTILMKEMKFKQITKINFPPTIIGVTLGLYLGYNGFGVWSIIWMFLGTELIRSILLLLFSKWQPKFIFSKSKFKFHFNFGYKLLLSGLLDTVFKNIYNLLIGKYFSAQTLGFYERSKQFCEYPSSTLTGILGKVTYPMLSKVQDDAVRLKNIYSKLIRISFFIIAPLMLGLAAIGEPLFLLLLGEDWLPAVLFFQIICLAQIFYPVHAFNLNILKVYGRSDLFLKLEIIKKTIVTISVIVAFQFGVLGLVWSSVFTSFASLGVNMYYSSNLINYPIKEQIKDLSPILFQSLATGFLMYYIVNLSLLDNQLFSQLIIASLIGLIFYFTLGYLNKKSPLHQAILLVINRNL